MVVIHLISRLWMWLCWNSKVSFGRYFVRFFVAVLCLNVFLAWLVPSQSFRVFLDDKKPNNVRSFAQTTSSHTIISHIAQCQQVPEPIQRSVMNLQQGERLLSDSAVYGSRKIFYDRIWSRLHGVTQKSEEMVINKSEGFVNDNIDDNKRSNPPDEAGTDPSAKPDEKRQRVQKIQPSL